MFLAQEAPLVLISELSVINWRWQAEGSIPALIITRGCCWGRDRRLLLLQGLIHIWGRVKVLGSGAWDLRCHGKLLQTTVSLTCVSVSQSTEVTWRPFGSHHPPMMSSSLLAMSTLGYIMNLRLLLHLSLPWFSYWQTFFRSALSYGMDNFTTQST